MPRTFYHPPMNDTQQRQWFTPVLTYTAADWLLVGPETTSEHQSQLSRPFFRYRTYTVTLLIYSDDTSSRLIKSIPPDEPPAEEPSVRQEQIRNHDHSLSAMDRPSSGSLLPRLAFLLLIGALNVHTRSLASPGEYKKLLSSKHCIIFSWLWAEMHISISTVNQVFHSKDDSDIQNQILAFLLRKNIMPVPEKDVIGKCTLFVMVLYSKQMYRH